MVSTRQDLNPPLPDGSLRSPALTGNNKLLGSPVICFLHLYDRYTPYLNKVHTFRVLARCWVEEANKNHHLTAWRWMTFAGTSAVPSSAV